MADAMGKKPCSLLKEVEVHVEAIQKLFKGHDHEKDLQELGDQACDINKRDKYASSDSLSTISQYIEKIHQVIYEEKTNLKLNPSSPDRQNMVNLAKEVSVIDTSSIEKALNNSVVLRTIMQHLTIKDLFNVRLVAKKWEDEATSQLLSTRRSTQVYFNWNENEQKFRNKVGTLEEFTASCYCNPLRKFPCSQFKLAGQACSLDFTAALSKFFSSHGHHIKSLSLLFRHQSASLLGIIRKIVFEWSPNLKSLTLNGMVYAGGNEENPRKTPEIENASQLSSNNGLKRPRLSLEHLEMSYEFFGDGHSATAQHLGLLIRDILLSAPNVKTISDHELRFTKEIVSAGKIEAVHHLAWKLYPQNRRMTRCVDFLQNHPKLTNVEVSLMSVVNRNYTTQKDPPANFLPSLQLLLQSSRETLRTLKFVGRFDSLTGASLLDIPVMKNLQKFQVYSWKSLEGGQGRLLPRGFSLKKLFPNLKTLVIKSLGDESENLEDNPFGQSCNSSTTVKQITISATQNRFYHFHPDWLRQAHDLYPNARVLKLDFRSEWREIPEICRIIWRSWNSLEELSITVFNSDSVNCTLIMDQILTGFDRETCRMLEKQRCCKHGLGAEKLERGLSIMDMKKLKSFQLISEVKPDFPLLSHVSVIHALEPMRKSQNLKVMINGVKLTEMIQDGRHGDFSVPDCQINMDK